MKRNCKAKEECKGDNGNCYVMEKNGLPVQCVGPWAENKYYFLERYLNASCEARRKFSSRGNAVFIDLFSGPGKCIVKNIKKEINNGGIRALLREEAPFNEFFYFDIVPENVKALKNRINKKGNYNFHATCCDSNEKIEDLVDDLSKGKKYYPIVLFWGQTTVSGWQTSR